MRIATYNLENLFARPAAMGVSDKTRGQQAIDDHARLNRLIEQAQYDEATKAELLAAEQRYRFAALNPPRDALLKLQRVRGQLYSRSREGVVSVKARGREDWTGWFELRQDDVRWQATENTARVIAETGADLLVCVEADSRPALLRFNEQVLGARFNAAYPHAMLIDGNDPRGIDLGVLSRHPVISMQSHVDLRNADGERVFSRDAPVYEIDLGERHPLLVLPNHFKSKRGGNDTASQARRRAQAEAVADIAARCLQRSPWVLIAGDLNDTPESEALAPLWRRGFKDVQAHPDYPQDRPGTYQTGLATQKLDYLISSPKLFRRLRHCGIERRGSYHPRLWDAFDTVKKAADEASDHHLVWAEFAF
jgi:endonuclease/exonuclease/phosphatase family metal-dependent hydrolase